MQYPRTVYEFCSALLDFSQHPIMVPSKGHEPFSQQHSVTSQNTCTISISAAVRTSNLKNKPHGWINIINTVQAECRNLFNSSRRVQRLCCLLPEMKAV
jgi:hypothetical protein